MQGQTDEIITPEAAIAAALRVLAARGRAIREERKRIMSSADEVSHSTYEVAKEVMQPHSEEAGIARQ